MEPHRLSARDARRIAITAQALTADRPTDLVGLVDRLTLLQIDPTAAIAPNADLVAWSRLGPGYRPEHLTRALEEDRALREHNAFIRPKADVALYLADMAVWPGRQRMRDWLEANAAFRADVLARLRADGPLLSRDIPDTAAQPWQSSGWIDAKSVTMMLEALALQRSRSADGGAASGCGTSPSASTHLT